MATPNKNKLRRKKRPVRKRNTNANARGGPTRVLVVKGPFPRRARVTLQFVDYNYLANVGSLYNSQRYQINNASNVSMTGNLYPVPSNELFTLYNTYRVVHISARFKFMNLESFPQQCAILPSLTDLGPNYSLLYRGSLVPFGRRNAVSAKTGKDSIVLTTSFAMSKLIGDPSYNFNPTYTGTTGGAAPTTLVYLNWGCIATNNCVSGIEYETTVRMVVDLFNQDFLYS